MIGLGRPTWLKKHAEAKDAFWRERNDAIYRLMVAKVPQVQGAAFTVAAKLIQNFATALKQPMDTGTAVRVVRANPTALDTALAAAGLSTAKVMEAGPLVTVRMREQEQVTVYGPDGKPEATGRRETLREMFQSRLQNLEALEPNSQHPDDPMLDELDVLSPLPPHLSMVDNRDSINSPSPFGPLHWLRGRMATTPSFNLIRTTWEGT